MVDDLLGRLGELDAWILLLLALALPFGETVALLDFVVPGEVGLILIGAAAVEADIPLAVVIALGTVGAFLGDSTSWYIGHRWGVGLVDRWGPVRRLLRPPLERGERYFARRGGIAILVGRFIGAMRAVVPLVAGASGMTYRRFVPWNLVASLSWVSVVVIVGATLGGPAARFLDRYGIVIPAVIVSVAVMWVASRALARRRSHVRVEQ